MLSRRGFAQNKVAMKCEGVDELRVARELLRAERNGDGIAWISSERISKGKARKSEDQRWSCTAERRVAMEQQCGERHSMLMLRQAMNSYGTVRK